jgi:hypothetical protein
MSDGAAKTAARDGMPATTAAPPLSTTPSICLYAC